MSRPITPPAVTAGIIRALHGPAAADRYTTQAGAR